MSQYQNLEDFLSDESFIDWVYELDPSAKVKWEKWKKANTKDLRLMDEAKSLLLAFSVSQQSVPQAYNKYESWAKVQTKIASYEQQNSIRRSHKIGLFTRYAAAIVLLIVGVLAIYKFNQPDYREYATAFGETRQLLLPDSSIVTLNANSTMRISANWMAQSERAVQLVRGEAFFDVTEVSDKEPRKFTVSTEDIKVEVLGTRFNVQQVETEISVVLESGKVKVNGVKHPDQVMFMSPGESVRYMEGTSSFQKRMVKVDSEISWTRGVKIFDDNSLNEVGIWLQQNFGYNLKVVGREANEKRLSGEIRTNTDISTVMRAIAASLDLEYEIEGSTIVVK